MAEPHSFNYLFQINTCTGQLTNIYLHFFTYTSVCRHTGIDAHIHTALQSLISLPFLSCSALVHDTGWACRDTALISVAAENELQIQISRLKTPGLGENNTMCPCSLLTMAFHFWHLAPSAAAKPGCFFDTSALF